MCSFNLLTIEWKSGSQPKTCEQGMTKCNFLVMDTPTLEELNKGLKTVSFPYYIKEAIQIVRGT